MILIGLMLGLIVFIVGFLALKTPTARRLTGGTGLVLLVVAAVVMIGHDTQHWGLHQTTTTTTTPLQSTVKNEFGNVLLYQPIEHARHEKVMLYRPVQQKHLSHTAAKLTTTVCVRSTATKAQLTTTTTRWTYHNAAWHWLFKWTGEQSPLIKQQQTFNLPPTWTTLSVSQARWLAKQAKHLQATAKQTQALELKQLQLAHPNLSKATLVKQVKAQQAKQRPILIKKLIKQAQQRSPY